MANDGLKTTESLYINRVLANAIYSHFVISGGGCCNTYDWKWKFEICQFDVLQYQIFTFHLLILVVKPRALRKANLITQQEPHVKKTMKEVSILDVGGKTKGNNLFEGNPLNREGTDDPTHIVTLRSNMGPRMMWKAKKTLLRQLDRPNTRTLNSKYKILPGQN